MNIHEIYSITKTFDDALIIDMLLDDGEFTERLNYIYRASDAFSPLTPLITQWIVENTPEILPYIPPPQLTPEELRALMPILTPRQFRDALIDADIMPDQVTVAISQIPDAKARAKALNAWEYPTQFTRTDPLIDDIGNVFNFTTQQIDEMWRVASGRGG